MSNTEGSTGPIIDEVADDTFEDLGTTPTTDADNAPDENETEPTA